MQIYDIFEKGKTNLSGLLNYDNLFPVSNAVGDAILTNVIEFDAGNKLDEETGN